MFYNCYNSLCFIPRNRRITLASTHNPALNNRCCATQLNAEAHSLLTTGLQCYSLNNWIFHW